MELTAGEILFLDTNVLLSATDRSRASHAAALAIIEGAPGAGVHLALSGQIVREYLVVATRPVEANGLGLDSHAALENANAFRDACVFFGEVEATTVELLSLIDRHALRGKRIHDAGIVATMIHHGIPRLVTDNLGDFATFPEIEARGVDDVSAAMGQQ